MDFSYDADGNITSDGVHTNTWDALNRLAQVQDFSAGSAMQFAYAPSGARYQEMTTIGAATTTFIEVNALFEVEYSSATGHTTYRASIMGGTGVVAIRTVRDDGVLTTRYVTGNHLGGVSVISDEVGTVDERMSYGAFGERRDPATWQPYTNPPDLTNITDKGYTGQQQLDAVRLVHMNGRVYDPEIGRFMSADPIVPDPLDGQSFARYAYVGNNPLSAIDPSGFDDLPPGYQLVFCTYVCGVSPEPQLAPLPPFNPAVDSFNPPALAQMPALLMSTMVPPSTPAVSGPQPIPTGSGNSGSTGSGNYNPGNFGSGNFLLPIDTPCQYGSNCGGNNGVQQAMNDTNGVQDVSWGDIDWGSMGGSGKLHAPPGPVEIPGPNGHYIGGPVAGPSRSPGSVGVTIHWANPTGGQIRPCGAWGCGYFGAPRDNGTRRHLGTDYLAAPGQNVYAVMNGTVTKIGHPYPDDLSFRDIHISNGGYLVNEMYVNPAQGIKIGVSVNAGDVIGTAQDLDTRYPGIPDHVHVGIWLNGNPVNPATLIPLPSVASPPNQ